jgi:ATP-binding cassette subfamily E protein 1
MEIAIDNRLAIDTDAKNRIAIINPEKCKPKKCKLECLNSCPVNKIGKICIQVTKTSQMSLISEALCIGCGICVKKCPFDAIRIINLPRGIQNEAIHRYGLNRFVLYRLPIPRLGSILGLVGTNGIGKTTVLQILRNEIKPNLGQFEDAPGWKEILKRFKGSEIQTFFVKILHENYKNAFKPQFVDQIPNVISGKIIDIINKKDQRMLSGELIKLFELESVLDREPKQLSGGELQRFAILITLLQDVNIFIFDEPTSYLDVKQRLMISKAIRKFANPQSCENYVILVEHDLSILDYMSDHICCLFGKPAAFGVVSLPYSVKEGINVFLDGYLPKENIRFRDYEISFKQGEFDQVSEERLRLGENERILTKSYPSMTKKFPNFTLKIESGHFTSSQIVVLLGENGTGKTTFVKILAGLDKEIDVEMPEMRVSYKPQIISPKFNGIVRDLLYARLNGIWTTNSIFKQNVFDPMMVEDLFMNEVKKLSGGEKQRVAMVVALGRAADLYLIDEPSAYLDVEQRILTARCIKKFIMLMQKTAFVVEHDFIMATYLADKVIVYEGTPGLDCRANAPCFLVKGMNKFLNLLGITFRRDNQNFRPRINKLDSVLDRKQKASGNYFYVEE